jgi:hypothetical protein
LNRIYIDWEVSKRIEKVLNEIHFFDVQIGELFAFYLSSITDQGIINDNLIGQSKTRLLSLKYRYFNTKEVKTNFNHDEIIINSKNQIEPSLEWNPRREILQE